MTKQYAKLRLKTLIIQAIACELGRLVTFGVRSGISSLQLSERMTTRSGLNYRDSGVMSETGHSQASGLETEGAGDMQKVLQMLLDDRRKREEEIAAERRQRGQEAAAERERQERETERRLQEMQNHVDALLKVVERSHEGASGAKRGARGAGDEKEVRLTKLSEADDVEAYLTTFERMMTAFEVQKERWVFKLAPYLTGKAQQAYAAMAAEDASEYEYLKAAILKRYNMRRRTVFVSGQWHGSQRRATRKWQQG